MTTADKKNDISSVGSLLGQDSVLGSSWVAVFEAEVGFGSEHFETAMQNLIKQPNINSTVILRADILVEDKFSYSEDGKEEKTHFESELAQHKPDIPTSSGDEVILEKNLDDVEVKKVPLTPETRPKVEIVRRIVPRNPFKDCIINQTCSILSLKIDSDEYDSTLVLYYPHIENVQDCPYYLPSAQAVGILLSKGKISVHYIPFNYKEPNVISDFQKLDTSNRDVRIAFRLLQTAKKHSTGVMDGYQKRVQHDMVVSKVAFQDRYIALKKKYSKQLVDNWVESTDPRKHVFEDIAIAAFLIELWSKIYKDKRDFEFSDLGCGNGVLVNILLSEGYKGVGIDARARKSWKTYSNSVQSRLKEQVIIPSILLKPHPAVQKMAPHLIDNGRVFQVPIGGPAENPLMGFCTSGALLNSPMVNTAQFPKNTFIIGNHSDELTCWIPLFGYPFLVIPCCSHALSGARVRYPAQKSGAVSTYAALVDHVEEISKKAGWKVEREMLRIPSTRNAAIIGYERDNINVNIQTIYDILAMEGGAEGWVESTMALTKRAPRTH